MSGEALDEIIDALTRGAIEPSGCAAAAPNPRGGNERPPETIGATLGPRLRGGAGGCRVRRGAPARPPACRGGAATVGRRGVRPSRTRGCRRRTGAGRGMLRADDRARAAQPHHRRCASSGASNSRCRPTRSIRGRRAKPSSKRCWRGCRTAPAPYRFLDLGTGSGCLLLALLSEFPPATGSASISPRARSRPRGIMPGGSGSAARAISRFGIGRRASPAGSTSSSPIRPISPTPAIPTLHAGGQGVRPAPGARRRQRRACLPTARSPRTCRGCCGPAGSSPVEIGAGQADSVAAILAANGLRDRRVRGRPCRHRSLCRRAPPDRSVSEAAQRPV